MAFFFQMRKNQPLSVSVQYILTAAGSKLQTASRLSRLQEKMYLCIMAQRLKMSNSFHRTCNGFLVYNISCIKRNIYTKSFFRQTFQYLHLHLSHNLHMDFSQSFVPDNMELRFFLLQLTQALKHFMDITVLRKLYPIGQNRLKKRQL